MSETRQYYDVRGNVTLEEIKTEEGEYRRTYYGYDTMNRLKYTAYDGSSGKTYVQYGYDNIGNMTEMVTGLSGLMADINGELPEGAARTKYEYDQYGHMSKMILPDGSEREYESDLTGNITKEVYPDGEISYTYSAAGELLSMTGTKGEESKTYQYQYDSLGRRKKAIHGEPENGYPNQTVYSYDEIGRLVKEEEQRGESRAISKEYIYDSASNVDTFILKEENTVLQNIRYNYDYLNRLVKVTDQKNGNHVAAEYSYDSAGRLSAEKQDNSQLETTYSYNAGGMVTGIVHKKGIEELASESYTYYADGMKKSENGKEYQYDGAGRLSIAGNPYGKYVYYDYDRRGNRVKETRMGEGTYSETNYEYNRNNELVKEEKITGVDPVSTTWYTYDARGNVLSSTVDEYSNAEAGAAEGITGAVLGESETSETAMYGYDVFGRMEQIVKGEQQIRYGYNADGQRTLKDADGTVSWYVWDGENIAAELEIGKPAVYYQRGLGLIAAESGNEKDYYLKNAHGDVTGVYSSQTDSLKKSYAYDPFGNIVNPSNINEIQPDDPNDTNPYRYAGEYYDRETGNYYLRARYYAPGYGRFTQIDPIRDGTNWYVYCDNDPVNRVDPTGLDSYVFWDPNDNGFCTRSKAEILKREMEAYYGTPCHMVDISVRYVGGEFLSAAEYFAYKWNLMGRAGNGKIEGVTLYFHGNYDRIAFKNSSGDWESRFHMDDINSKLNIKTMDVLLLLGCNNGKVVDGQSNFATEMACRMNANYVIASDGKTEVTNLKKSYITTTWDPKGFKVYKKLSSGKVSAGRLGSVGYLGFSAIVGAAKN